MSVRFLVSFKEREERKNFFFIYFECIKHNSLFNIGKYTERFYVFILFLPLLVSFGWSCFAREQSRPFLNARSSQNDPLKGKLNYKVIQDTQIWSLFSIIPYTPTHHSRLFLRPMSLMRLCLIHFLHAWKISPFCIVFFNSTLREFFFHQK